MNCIHCGRKYKVQENGLCRKCAFYLLRGEEDDFVGGCQVWWEIMEKVEKYKKLGRQNL